MKTAAHAKGDRFEREIVDYLREHLGAQVARQRVTTEDRGDICGVVGWTLELKNYADTLRAIRDGLSDLEREQAHAGTPLGAVIIKRRGVTDPARALFVMELGNALPVLYRGVQ
jgi:hypothetical protein